MLAGLAAVFFTIAASGCTPLGALNAITPSAAPATMKGWAYGSEPRQKLDIYLPPASAFPAPVIVFFYGGSWNSGSRTDYAFVGHALAGRGMIAVIADYRLYPQVRYPQFLEDSARAVAWTIREIGQFGGDPNRVFAMGHSAGAYNAAMLALDGRLLQPHGLTPQALRGWIGLAGPYNFLPIENPEVQPVFFHPNTPVASQPIHHVRPGAPPALLIAAKDDEVVKPLRNTARMAERMRDAGNPVTELYFDGIGHATLVATLAPPLRHFAPTLDAIERFVRAGTAQR